MIGKQAVTDLKKKEKKAIYTHASTHHPVPHNNFPRKLNPAGKAVKRLNVLNAL